MPANTVSDLRNPAAAAHLADVKPPQPPRTLTPEELRIWKGIIAERSHGEWRVVDIDVALLLIDSILQRQDEQKALRKEGSVLRNRFGDPLPNPRSAIIGRLTNTILRCRTALRLGATDEQTRTRDNMRRADRQLAAGDMMADASGGLIPRRDLIMSPVDDDGLLPHFGPTGLKFS